MRNGWAIGLALLATGASATAWVSQTEPWSRLSRGWAVLTGAKPDQSYDSATGGNRTDPSYASCYAMHPSGRPPILPEKMATKTAMRCRVSFGLLHSGTTRTPLWVSERLTRDGIAAAGRLERVDAFEADESLPKGQRAELKDYRRSRWDRGHMAPNADMPDPKSQAESFELSNITPQAPDLNRGSWADLESDVRRYASRAGMAYVVTGVLYEGGEVGTLPGGRVIIPTSIWKAVLGPNSGSVVMVARNAKGGRPVPMSIDAFRARTGIDPFPGITEADRTRTLEFDAENGR